MAIPCRCYSSSAAIRENWYAMVKRIGHSSTRPYGPRPRTRWAPLPCVGARATARREACVRAPSSPSATRQGPGRDRAAARANLGPGGVECGEATDRAMLRPRVAEVASTSPTSICVRWGRGAGSNTRLWTGGSAVETHQRQKKRATRSGSPSALKNLRSVVDGEARHQLVADLHFQLRRINH